MRMQILSAQGIILIEILHHQAMRLLLFRVQENRAISAGIN